MYPSRNDSRRPRRRDRNDRGGRDNRGDSGFDRERSEREFTDEMHGRFQQFLASDEQGMALEPMNSFKRRVVHNLAKEYGIDTESRGEERDRHVYLIRTPSSATPPGAPTGGSHHEAPASESGDEVDEESMGNSVSEDDESVGNRVSAQNDRPPRRERPREDRGSRDSRPPRRDRFEDDRPPRQWDFGSQTFPVIPGENGVHIAVKRDGSIEIFNEKDRNHVVAERVVTSKQFRVRKGKILQPGEPGW